MVSLKTLFVTSYQTTKKLLTEKTDIDVTIARFMFEKFGTFPEEVVELDQYQKGIIYAFLEDMVKEHEAQKRKLETRKPRRRR